MNQEQEQYQEEVQQLVTQTLPPGTQVVVRYTDLPVETVGLADEAARLATDTLSKEDMIIPRLRLVQAQSTFSDKEGWLFNSLTGEVSETVRVVALRVGKNRVMWPEKFVRDQDPLCASDDAVAPRKEYMNTYARNCNSCRNSAWLDDEPPPCNFGYTFLLACRDIGDLPVLLSTAPTSVTAAKQANTLIRALGVKYEMIIGTKRKTNDKGKFFVLTFTLGEPIAPESIARYANLSLSLSRAILDADTGPEEPAGPPVFDDETPPDIDVVIEEQQPDFPF